MFENVFIETEQTPEAVYGKKLKRRLILVVFIFHVLFLPVLKVIEIIVAEPVLIEKYDPSYMVATASAPAPISAASTVKTKTPAKTPRIPLQLPPVKPDPLPAEPNQKTVTNTIQPVTELPVSTETSGNSVATTGSENPLPSENKGGALTGDVQGSSTGLGESLVPTEIQPAVTPSVPGPPVPPPPTVPRIVNQSEAFLRGTVINQVTPEYPSAAQDSQIQGTVQVELVIDEKGFVIQAIVKSGSQIFHKAALAAAKKWKFKPPIINNEPVRVKGLLTFKFVL